ncbi:MAG: sulfite exporter TauE/SafE family protein [Candidatus Saccharibacteria bacterium]
MKDQYTTLILGVSGMSCHSCETRIDKGLKKIKGVVRVRSSFKDNSVEISYDGQQVSEPEIRQAIAHLGYGANDHGPVTRAKEIRDFIAFAAVAIILYLLVKNWIGFNNIPQIDKSMSIGLLFLAGILTSVHCVAMCGGIVISQTVKISDGPPDWKERLWPSLSYNGGRVLAYTIIGGLAGLLGSVVTFSNSARGVVTIVAGVLMLIIGLNMLGMFSWTRRFNIQLPAGLGKVTSGWQSSRRPFYIGLANGLMPCGPLQAMQLYALGTGSFIAGASSMLVFGLGTIPLLLIFGVVNTFLSQKFSQGMIKASSVLVTVLALVMVSRGMALSGISLLPAASAAADAVPAAKIVGNTQTVTTTVDANGYSPSVIAVQKGVPVRWIINARTLTGCNNPITVPEYGIQKKLVPGENVITFTPNKTGVIRYSCWMGMLTGSFQVVDDIKNYKPDPAAANPSGGSFAGGGCCGATPERFKNGQIPVDQIGVAKMAGDKQVLEMKITANGYEPAVLVVQKGVPVDWLIEGKDLNSCNYQLVFPDYGQSLDIKQGDNGFQFTPQKDFGFQCGMGMLNGYVKVVDNINKIDKQQIIKEVQNYKPAGGGGSCCGGGF